MRRALFVALFFCTYVFATVTANADPADRQAFFGETHIHTVLSFDAYIFGNRNDPDDAYRYAKGEALTHPAGFKMQLKRPLDFQAVTDHAMYLGMLPAMHDPKQEVSKHPISLSLRKATTPADRLLAFQGLFTRLNPTKDGETDDLYDPEISKSAWQQIIETAEAHNEPGKFTTFIAYEYTSGPQNQNMHRNVIFRGSKAPALPFSRIMSLNPEDLWRWMDDLRAQGIDTIAIPHNSNGSNGLMFQNVDWNGNPIDQAYAQTRMRNEPVVEVTQVKGDSETHPLLSPNDEWADFETMPFRIGAWESSQPRGSYVREAYLNGLKMEAEGRGNPYKFGLIGASDTHVAAGAFDESNYWSKVGIIDANGKLRGSVPVDAKGTYNENNFHTWSASGLAGIWAEENTRDSLFAAMQRKEVFATTGPRLRLRFFASTDFGNTNLDDPLLMKQAYARGVAMGGDLVAGEAVPQFIVWALRDELSYGLQRLQVIKGWVDAGGDTHERVYDVACAGGAKIDPVTQRCPDNGAKVDLENCAASANTSADELKTLWQDPDYQAGQKAFYYARVLENPSCRWSSWDAMRAGVKPRPNVPATIQERAYSSPIWVN